MPLTVEELHLLAACPLFLGVGQRPDRRRCLLRSPWACSLRTTL